MYKKSLVISILTVAAGLFFLQGRSEAMPNFARKYNAECSMCHTIVPKLNKTGYEFRAAGYRFPSQIGKEEEKAFDLANFFTARLQEQYKYQNHKDVTPSKNSVSDQLEFFEFTLYPLTGSWGKYFGSLSELSMAPDEFFEVENAFVRGVYGDENGWFQARIGIMHPWEGFGASDRPIGNIRPLFQKNAVKPGSPYIFWNLDESAIEAGYDLAKTGTFIAARVSNGIIWRKDGSGAGDPAQGGDMNKVNGVDKADYNDKNYQIALTQFYTQDAAITLTYYYGTVPFPDPNVNITTTTDTFQRLAAYANYWPISGTLNLLAGYEYGQDSLKNTSLSSSVGNSNGYFGEIDLHTSPKLAFAARYDFFDPSDKVNNNSVTAETISANYYLPFGLQFIGDYQHKDTQKTSSSNNVDDQLVARLIFIW